MTSIRFHSISALLLALPAAAQQAPLEPPRLGLVGAPRTSERSFTTEIRRDGSLWVGGEEVGWAAWRAALVEAARAHPGKELQLGDLSITVSELDVVLVADRDLPWGALQYLVAECAKPDIAAPRVFYGARREDGTAGAFAIFLPADDGGLDGEPVEATTLRILADGADTHPSRLFGQFAAVAEALGDGSVVTVDADGSARWSSMLAAAEMAARAGIASLHVGGQPTAEQDAAWQKAKDLRAVVRAAPSSDVSFAVGAKLLRGGEVEIHGAEAGAGDGDLVGFSTQAAAVEVRRGGRRAGRVTREVRTDGRMGATLGRYAARGSRQLFAREFPERARSVEAGLRWLVEQQQPDGSWEVPEGGDPVAVTAVATLAMLGDGSTLRAGPCQDAIKRAIQWLRERQREDGQFVVGDQESIRGHALATLAMVEARVLSKYRLLDKYARLGLARLVTLRNEDGGWGGGGSTTVETAWASLALGAAIDGRLTPEDARVEATRAWLSARRDPESGRFANADDRRALPRRDAAHAGAFPAEHGELATAAGLVGLAFLGRDALAHDAGRSIEALLARPPVWNANAGTIDGVYWLFAADALHQLDADAFAQWSKAIDAAVPPQQRPADAEHEGSWDPVSAWGDRGGRAWTTAVMVLTLQAPYRYGRLR